MEKEFEKALVLGKFMPTTLGHIFLIDTAISKSNKVFVFICSLPSEPINGQIRYKWLRDIYSDNKNVEIIHITEDLPQKPEDVSDKDSFYNDYWVPVVKNKVKDLDVVFTSELYGDEFAEYLGIKHFLVDLERKIVPISGTKVRENYLKHWEFIPKEVKKFYMKKIAILGPESVGKSTLTKKLSETFNSISVEEYGRTYVETIKNSKDLINEDYYKIALRHNEMLLEAEKYFKPFLFSDTEAITTKLFGEMYIEGFKEDRLEEIIQEQNFDLYFLLNIDVPWVDDGTRDFPNDSDRIKHFNKIKNELERLNKNFIIINGTNYDERFNKVKEIIEKLYI